MVLAGVSTAGRILKGDLAGEAAEAVVAAAGVKAATGMASTGVAVTAGVAGGRRLAACGADAMVDRALTPGFVIGAGDSCGNQKSGVVIT